jgi:catalase (peroxidase I)
MEAVKEMEKGKKVKRKVFGDGVSFRFDGEFKEMVNHNNNNFNVNLRDITATDWEVVEELETLFSKSVRKSFRNRSEEIVFGYEDIKQALKEFLDCLPEDGFQNILNKAKEVFGEEMLK